MLWLSFTALGLGAAEVMPAQPTRYFNDFAGATRPATQERLNAALEQFEKETSSQIVVAVFSRMETGSSVEDYVNRMFRAWKIGQKQRNNGVLLAVFLQERKLRIEVGYGLEGAIPDATAKTIIDREITPRFRAGDIEGGLAAGVSALMQAARGEYVGTGRTAQQSRRRGGFPWPLMVVVFFILFFAIASFRRRRGTIYGGRRHRGSSWGGPIIFSGGGWGGGGGGGWSGGGGFSGGGGSSGGGGASGSW